MSRVRSALVLAMVFVSGSALHTPAQAQSTGRSFLGLLSQEQVQKELKLSEGQIGKVREIDEKLRKELRPQWTSLRETDDWEKRWAKWKEMVDQFDEKARGQLRDVLSREQLMRLYQIRTQVRGVVATLSREWTANRLKLTDEQKKKVAEIDKATRQKQSEAFQGYRDLSQEERRARFAEFGKIRQKADEQALALLNADQKEALKKMQGKKFELQRRSPR